MLSRPPRRSAGLLFAVPLLLTLVVAAPAAAKNPPGNNGTVKVDRLAFDEHPNNQPHVGCRFEIDFYGFDVGVADATAIFEAHPPTGTGVLVTRTATIGAADNHADGSEPGWDAAIEVDLTTALAPYAAHAQQGYHVKLTIHAPGSQGADVKHKVFWVTGCETAVAPPPPPPPPNPPQGGGSGTQGNVPPRSGTAASSGGRGAVLPDTAMDAAASGGLLLVGLVLAGGAVLSAAAVRSEVRSRRR